MADDRITNEITQKYIKTYLFGQIIAFLRGYVLWRRPYNNNLLANTSNEEIFFHDFIVILKQKLQNYSKI